MLTTINEDSRFVIHIVIGRCNGGTYFTNLCDYVICESRMVTVFSLSSILD